MSSKLLKFTCRLSSRKNLCSATPGDYINSGKVIVHYDDVNTIRRMRGQFGDKYNILVVNGDTIINSVFDYMDLTLSMTTLWIEEHENKLLSWDIQELLLFHLENPNRFTARFINQDIIDEAVKLCKNGVVT